MILVTTDGSSHAARVIPHAARFAAAAGEAITLLRVIEASEERARALEEELRKTLSQHGALGEVRVERPRRGESLSQTILRVAAELEARLICMDSRGAGALHHALLGSVAMDVVARSSLPVLVGGSQLAGPQPHDPYLVLVGSDGSPQSEAVFPALEPFLASGGLAVAVAGAYAPRLGDRGEAIEVQELRRTLEDMRRRHLEGRGEVLVRRATGLTPPEALLIQAAKDLGASAIALATRGHDPRRHVVLGSFASGVLSRSPLPVILVHA